MSNNTIIQYINNINIILLVICMCINMSIMANTI